LANDFKRQGVPYDREAQEAMFAHIRETYTPEILKELEGKGFDSDLPVFIVGMPRSGTTLTEQIISSHPNVYGAGELIEFGTVSKKFGDVTPDNAAAMGEAYITALKTYDPSGNAKRITDKMPANFTHIGKILSILPQAKIIHCRRDPVDTCLSCFKQNFSRGQYWSYDLEDLAHHYDEYEKMMNYWRDVLGNQFLEIDYEDTVGDFENQARKLIDFVGLEWNNACLEPHKQKRDVLTASKAQVIQPVYKTSVKSWQNYETYLEPLMNALRYNKDTGQRE
jgi:hypothetical protein